MNLWKRLKSNITEDLLSKSFWKELKNDAKTVVRLSLTFVGATLIGRSVWGWIVDYQGRGLAFVSGLLLLFLVVFVSNHKHIGK